jgi:hypothetical protein
MHIDSYSFGRMVIDGASYEDDVILLPSGVRPGWWRVQGHEVSMYDIANIFAAGPDRIIIGTGASGVCQVLDEVVAACHAQKIELIVKPTPEAVVEYNMLTDRSRTACAFHLTC